MNEGSQNWDPVDATTPMVIAEELGESKKQTSATPQGEKGNRIWPQTTEVHGASQVVLVVKNLPANAGDIREAGSFPGSRRSS